MTTCQSCHLREAEVELTQVAGDEVTSVRLCGKCAAERGMAPAAPVADSPLGAFLAAMGQGVTPLEAAAASRDACPACGATLDDFRASGRLGCGDCWNAFERPLRELLTRVHGGTRHVGRGYRSAETALDPESDLIRLRLRLREALREAVNAEDFERAAELRDRLRGLEAP